MADLLTQIKDKWFVVIFVASLILWYGSVNSRLNAVEAKQVEQATTLAQIADIKTDVAVIKANVDFIKEQVTRIAN